VINNWRYGQNQQINISLNFDEDEQIIVISKEDKEYLQTHLPDSLVYSANNIKLMKQLSQCVKKICKLSFENWKEFLINKILEYFRSGDENQIFAGIIAFLQASKVFEYESGEMKLSFKKAFEILNPFFFSFLEGLIIKLDSPKAALIIYKIFKIFFKSIQMDVSSVIIEPKNFEIWNVHFLNVIKYEFPQELRIKTEKTEEVEALAKNIYWKLKKLVFMITYRVYQKYGYSSSFNNEDISLLNFSKLVESNYVKIYFDFYLETLYKSKIEFVPEYILCLIFKFLAYLLSRYQLVDELKSHLIVILTDHIIQNAKFTVKDFETWTQDPKTYISKVNDLTENYYVLRYTVTQFIKSLVTFKKLNEKGKPVGKSIYYLDCLNYFVSILEMYEDNISKGIDVDVIIKEAVLFILEKIAPTFNK